jgi:phosphatidate cytidylyltransferase
MRTPPEAYLVVEGLAAVLIAASLIGFILHLSVKDGNSRAAVDNLNARIRAWWVMVILLSGAALSGRAATVVLFALLSFGALREFEPVRLVSVIVLLGQYWFVWNGTYGLFLVFVPLCAILLRSWGLILCVYCISYVPALLMLETNRNVLLIAFLIIIVQSSDVLQYVFGKLLGRHKIAPHLSPGKTIEGFIGGIAGATILGASLWWITPFDRAHSAAMALTIALTGFLGGLTLSAIKRRRGIKDWGQLIEGHGGLLDRLDSICFSAPVFFHLMRYFVQS